MTRKDLLISILIGLLVGFFLFGGYLIGESEASGPCVDRPCVEEGR